MKVTFTYFFLISWSTLFAQQGFHFLNLPNSSRAAALGGFAVSSNDHDIAMGYHNPAILGDSTLGDIYIMYHPYLAGINRMSTIAKFSAGKIGPLTAGILFTDYGTFDEKTNWEQSLVGSKHKTMSFTWVNLIVWDLLRWASI